MADNKILSDFVATAYNDGDVETAIKKFPELHGYDKKLLADFVATAYKDGDVNVALKKFPEFNVGYGVARPEEKQWGNEWVPSQKVEGKSRKVGVKSPELGKSNTIPTINFFQVPTEKNSTIPTVDQNDEVKLYDQKQQLKSNPNIDANNPKVYKESTDERVLNAAKNTSLDFISSLSKFAGDINSKIKMAPLKLINPFIEDTDFFKEYGKYINGNSIFDKVSSNLDDYTESDREKHGNLDGTPELLGSSIPFAASAVADIVSGGTLTPAITSAFGASGYGDGLKMYDELHPAGDGNEYARTGAGVLYGAIQTGVTHYLLGKAVPKGLISKIVPGRVSDLISKSVNNVFRSNPELLSTGGEAVVNSFAKAQPTLLKQLAKNTLHSVGAMETMELSKKAVDELYGKHSDLKEWVNTGIRAGITGVLFPVLTLPFSIHAQSAANTARRNAQGNVTLTFDAKGKPVEVIEGLRGLTPEGKEVKLTQENVNNSFTMTTSDFNRFMEQKGNAKVNDREVFSNNVKQSLTNLSNKETGAIQTATDSNGERRFIAGVDKNGDILGLNGEGYTEPIGTIYRPEINVGDEIGSYGTLKSKNDTEYVFDKDGKEIKLPVNTFDEQRWYDENTKLETSNVADIHQSILDEYDKRTGYDPRSEMQDALPGGEAVVNTQVVGNPMDPQVHAEAVTRAATSKQQMDEAMKDAGFGIDENTIVSASPEEQAQIVQDIIADEEMTPVQKDAVIGYIDAMTQVRTLNDARQEQRALRLQQAQADVKKDINETSGTIVTGTLKGSDEPIRIVKGLQVMPTADGTGWEADADNSEVAVYYTDKDGKTQVTTADDVVVTANEHPDERIQAVQQELDAEDQAFQQQLAALVSSVDNGQLTVDNSTGSATDEQQTEVDASTGSATDGQLTVDNSQPTQGDVEYPLDKNGNIDFGQFTPEHHYLYAVETEGKDVANEDLNNEIARQEKELGKFKKKIADAAFEKKAVLRSKLKDMQRYMDELTALKAKYIPEVQPEAIQPDLRNEKPQERNARWGEPQSLRELILRKFINGARLRWSDKTSDTGAVISKGLGAEYRGSNDERKSHFGFLSAEGQTPEEMAHQIWQANAYEPGQFEDMPLYGVDTQDILGEILDVMNTHRSTGTMINEVEGMKTNLSSAEQAYIDQLQHEQEQQYLDEYDDETFAQILGLTNFTPEQLQELQNLLNDGTDTTTTGGSQEGHTSESTPEPGAEMQGTGNRAGQIATNEGRNEPGSGGVEGNSEQQQPLVHEGEQTPKSPKGDLTKAEQDTADLDKYVEVQQPNLNPTASQKESGNYAKARVNLQGYNITIENPKGSTRSGVDPDGKKWSITMNNHYGELDGTKGYDGDPIDVFIGPNPKEGGIWVVDQTSPLTPLLEERGNAPKFDESKVMLGFDSAEEAKVAYLSNYEPGWDGFGAITPAGDKFKAWLYDGAQQRKPYAEYKDTPDAVESQEPRAKSQDVVENKLQAYDAAVDVHERVQIGTEIIRELEATHGLGESIITGSHQEMADVYPEFDEDDRDYVLDGKVAGCYYNGKLAIDIAGCDNSGVLIEAFVHENVHRVVKEHYTEEELESIHDQIPLSELKYVPVEDRTSKQRIADEWLAYTTESLLENNTVDDILSGNVQNWGTLSPYTQEQITNIINTQRNGKSKSRTTTPERKGRSNRNNAATGRAGKTPTVSETIGTGTEANQPTATTGNTDTNVSEQTAVSEREKLQPGQSIADFAKEVSEKNTSNNEERALFRRIQEENPLVVLHNISEQSLLRAIDGDGLIAPSIAITNVNNPYTDFGEITLVGKKEMIDPKSGEVKVFAGDVYSPTVPRPKYKVDSKSLQKWRSEIANKAFDKSKEVSSLINNSLNDYNNFVKDLSSNSAQSIVKNESNNLGLKLAYLIENNISFKVPTKIKEFSFHGYTPSLTSEQIDTGKSIYEKMKKEYDDTKGNLSESTKQEIIDYITNTLVVPASEKSVNLFKRLKEKSNGALTEDWIMQKQKEAFDNIHDKVVRWPDMEMRDLYNLLYPKTILDESALRDAINKKVSNKAFSEWLNTKIINLQGEKYFESGNKKVPYTSENILDHMIGKTRGQEEGMTFGMNKAKSFSIKQFNDIPSIQAMRKNIISKEQMNDIDEAYKAEYFELADKLKYKYSDRWSALDDLGKALADYYKGYSVKEALRRNDYGIQGESYFKDFADRLKSNPVDYFEAKMQRIVPVSEFYGAIVPKETSKELVSKLKENGIQVKKYSTKEERLEQTINITKSDDIRFRRKPEAFDTAKTTEEKYAAGSEIMKELDDVFGYETISLKDDEALIEKIPQYADKIRGNYIGGVFVNGEVMVNMQNHDTGKEVIETYFHENTHMINRKLFSPKEMVLMYRELEEKEKVLPKGYEGINEYQAADEVLAHAVEKLVKENGYEKFISGDVDLSLYSEPLQNKIKQIIDYYGKSKLSRAYSRGENDGNTSEKTDGHNERNGSVGLQRSVGKTGKIESHLRSTVPGRSKGILQGKIVVDGVERPTTNSLGQPIHPTEEGVKNFWKWFGDSKVVDKQGRPLVVYHNSTSNSITEFNPFRSFGKMTEEQKLRLNDNLNQHKDGIKSIVRAGTGIWFTPLKEGYEAFGENKYNAYIKIENPLKSNSVQSWGNPFLNNDTFADGVLVYDNNTLIEVIAFNPTQIKSATGNNGSFSSDDTDVRFKIIGERGAGNLDKAEETSVRLDNLKVAREMEGGSGIFNARSYRFDQIPDELKNDARIINRGEDTDGEAMKRIQANPQAKAAWADYVKAQNDLEEWNSLSKKEQAKRIRFATGWEKGVDGLWRYEIDDLSQMDLKPIDLSEELINGKGWFDGTLTLGDLFRETELFKSYPELKDIKLSFGHFENLKTRGSYNKETNTIQLPAEALKRDVLMHSDESAAKQKELSKQFDAAFKKFDSDKMQKVLEQMASESEKGKSGFNLDMSKYKETAQTLIHEIQHAIQEIEGFASGGNPDKMGRYTIEENKKILEQKYSHLPSYKAAKENGELDKWVIDMVNATGTGITPQEAYKRLAGEVEARNASARMNMSAEERRNTLLSETADVAPEDQIVLMDGQGIQDARPEYRNVSLTDYAKAVKGWNEREVVRAKSQESVLSQAPKGDVKNTFGSVHEFTFADEDITEVRKKCS
jgi:hypothetical protein